MLATAGPQRPKLSRRLTTAAGLGETTFTVGTLLMVVALVLGVAGGLSGNAALLLRVVGLLLAGVAYGGIKPPTKM